MVCHLGMQDLTVQRRVLLTFGVKPDFILKEKASGPW